MPLRLPKGIANHLMTAKPINRKRMFLRDLAQLLHTIEPNEYKGINDLFDHRRGQTSFGAPPPVGRTGPLELPFAPDNRRRLTGQPLIVFHTGRDLSRANIRPGLHTGTLESAMARIDAAPFDRAFLNELEIIPRVPLGSPRRPLRDYTVNLFEDMRDPDIVEAVDGIHGPADPHYLRVKKSMRDEGFSRLNEIYDRKRASPFDSVFYRNAVEDAGSVSVNILDPSIIRRIKAKRR